MEIFHHCQVVDKTKVGEKRIQIRGENIQEARVGGYIQNVKLNQCA